MSKFRCPCCTEFEEGMRQIAAAQTLEHFHGGKYTAGIFRFCPWCGTELEQEAEDE